MSVTRDYSIQNIENKDTFASAPTDYSGYSSGAVQGANALLGGAISRTSTSGGRVATVKAGEDIRPALESLRSAGGGTLLLLAGTHRPTYDIVGIDGINIIGEGIDQTIIDFGGATWSIKYGVGALPIQKNFKISNLTVKNSNDSDGAIYLNYVSNFTLDTVKVSDCSGDGMKIDNGKKFSILNCIFEANGSDGLVIGETVNSTEYFVIQNCLFHNNTLSGFKTQITNVSNGTLIGCQATHNYYGYYLGTGDSFILNGCQSVYNTVGFFISSTSTTLVGCIADESTTGFDINNKCSLVGCHASHSSALDFDFSALTSASAGEATLVGCNFNENGATQPESDVILKDLFVQAIGNSMQSTVTSRKILKMTNNSGSSISSGQVVVMSATSSGYEIQRTTTVGDDKVLGMALQTIPNTSTGQILAEGKTSLLKVNGTTDIAIGDFLSTYSVAGIAAKANDGDMAFAIALEAYTANDSNGVIDALIISPRKVGASGGGGGGGLTALQVESLISIQM